MENAKVILDLNNWQGFVVVLVALLGLFILVGNAIKIWRELKKPRADVVATERQNLQTISDKLDAHENDIKDLRDAVRLMCQANQALLNHALHNGNTKEMEDAAKELAVYLQNRI